MYFRKHLAFASITFSVVLLSCGGNGDTAENEAPNQHNTLTAAEEAEGWKLLFDGHSFDGWRGLGRDTIPAEHWIVEDGNIRKVASGEVPTAADGQPLEGGDILTIDTFGDFELVLEWKVSPGANVS